MCYLLKRCGCVCCQPAVLHNVLVAVDVWSARTNYCLRQADPAAQVTDCIGRW